VQKSKLDDRYGADVGNIPNANQKGCSQQDYRSEACTATLQQYGRSGEQGPGTRHPVPKDNQDEEIGEEPEEDEEETATLFEQASMGHSRVVLPSPQGTSRKPACMKSSRKKKEEEEEDTAASFVQTSTNHDSVVSPPSATGSPTHTFLGTLKYTSRKPSPISAVQISWNQGPRFSGKCNFSCGHFIFVLRSVCTSLL